jgi:biopolymer transport protein ExbB
MAHLMRSEKWNTRNWNWLAVLCVAVALTMSTLPQFGTQLAWAQDDTEMATDDAADEPAADDAAKPAAAPAAAAPAASGSSAQKSYLMWMIEASGIFGAVIALESFVLVALIAMNTLQIRRNNFLPQPFIDAFEQKLQAKDYQGAYETAKGDESFLAKVLTGGLGKLSKGYEEAVQGMQEVGEEEAMELEHKLSYISLIATTAPMLGLLGTVQGMIASFRVIATSETAPKPKDLADGISTALFTTLEGLVVAIPAILAYGLYRNKVSKLTFEVGLMSEGLMSRFSTVGKRPAAGAAPAAAPTAPAAPTK